MQNRQQCKKINSTISDFQTILSPKMCSWTITFPYLYKLYSYLHQRFHFISLQMTCVLYLNKNSKQLKNVLNNTLDNIGNLLNTNKLILNVKKLNIIIQH